jgi:hypothetical protein
MSRGVKRKAVEEAGGSGSGDASNTLFMDLQMRVKTLEVEMERMKEDRIQLLGRKEAANDDDGADEAATPPETRAVVSTAGSRADPAVAPCPAAARHISSLGEDLLLEIFLLLPSLATLVRAAFTCPAWRRAVASSPAFRRRFSAHHPPPFLGFFFQIPRRIVPNVPAFPAFAPARTRDRDLAAAIRGGDFFLTSLQGRRPADDHELLSWEIMDGSRGYALLVNGNAKTFAVFNPVTRHTERVFDIVPLDSYGTYRGLIGVLLWADEDSMSYRVVLIAQEEKRRVRLIVFSSDTGLWSVTPFVDFPERPYGQTRMQANGFLHWFYKNQKNERCMMSLNIDAMEFSVAELPQCLRGRSLDIGRSKDGTTCIVYADKFSIGFCLMHKGDGNGIDRWEVDRVVPMHPELLQRVLPSVHFGENNELTILEVRNGYVYLATSKMHHQADTPCWFMTLCMETMELEVLFRRTFDNFVHPYTMAWPPSLLGNNNH